MLAKKFKDIIFSVWTILQTLSHTCQIIVCHKIFVKSSILSGLCFKMFQSSVGSINGTNFHVSLELYRLSIWKVCLMLLKPKALIGKDNCTIDDAIKSIQKRWITQWLIAISVTYQNIAIKLNNWWIFQP